MILISHRGNIGGKIIEMENRPEYIDLAISLGYEVEIDVRTNSNSLYLGHDTPDHSVDIDWLYNRLDRLWIHTKDFETLCTLIDTRLRIFYHEKEQHTIIHRTNLIWSHNLLEANRKSVIPLLSSEDVERHRNLVSNVHAVCSDYINLLK